MVDLTAFGQLTEPQRETLRLYHQHLLIKEIAEQLGIAESTVNQRLTQCRKAVGAPSSRAAAKGLAQYEKRLGLCSKSAHQFSTMAPAAVLRPHEGLDAMETGRGEQDSEMSGSEQPALPDVDTRRPLPSPFAIPKMRDHTLDGWTRITLVLPVAALLLSLALILVLLGIGLQDALVALQHLFVRPS